MVSIVIASSCLATLAVTPIAGRLAVRWGFIDRPADHKFHARATPLLGGLALYAGIVPVVLFTNHDRATWIFAAVATMLFLVGLWDDRHHLSVRVRLLAQVLAAAILVASGFHVELPVPAWINVVLSLLWVVGITNAFNLLDSMDGVATGIAVIASAGFLLLAGSSSLGVVLAAALVGATLGFLTYNLPPASIFMGDGGSMLVGISLATLGLCAEPGIHAGTAWMVPVLLLGVLIFDTTLVCLSRLRRGKNPMTHPGKDHFAHRLAHRGLGVRGALVCLYVLGGLGGFLAYLVLRSDPVAAWTLGGGVALAAVGGMVWLERPAVEEAQRSVASVSRKSEPCAEDLVT